MIVVLASWKECDNGLTVNDPEPQLVDHDDFRHMACGFSGHGLRLLQHLSQQLCCPRRIGWRSFGVLLGPLPEDLVIITHFGVSQSWVAVLIEGTSTVQGSIQCQTLPYESYKLNQLRLTKLARENSLMLCAFPLRDVSRYWCSQQLVQAAINYASTLSHIAITIPMKVW